MSSQAHISNLTPAALSASPMCKAIAFAARSRPPAIDPDMSSEMLTAASRPSSSTRRLNTFGAPIDRPTRLRMSRSPRHLTAVDRDPFGRLHRRRQVTAKLGRAGDCSACDLRVAAAAHCAVSRQGHVEDDRGVRHLAAQRVRCSRPRPWRPPRSSRRGWPRHRLGSRRSSPRRARARARRARRRVRLGRQR